MFKDRLQKFLSGRNGMDELARFYSTAAVVLLIASLIFSALRLPVLAFVIELLTLVCIVMSCIRIFSRSLEKCRRRNAGYLALRHRLSGWFVSRKAMFSQRREYRFFKCPKCRAVMRVPRGKGNIMIKCRCCGEEFKAKS